MPVKDYYKILELEPGAGEEAIKKNFRRLALRYHPDTNQHNRHTDAWYREIQEAYEVLSHPDSKQQYLQQRWLVKSKGQAFADTAPLTPEFIAKKCKAVCTQVGNMDHFRMDHFALQKQLLELLNDDVMDAIQLYNEAEHNQAIIHYCLRSLEPLEYDKLSPVLQRLYRIALPNTQHTGEIKAWEQRRKNEDWWARHQWWVIALATLLLCGVIIVLAG